MYPGPTAKAPELVNRKCLLGTRFYNFRPLHRPYFLKLSKCPDSKFPRLE